MADHHDPGERRLVLSAGPDTPPVLIRRRRRVKRPVVTETGRRRLETRRNVVVVGQTRGRGQHPKHPVHRVPGADRVAQARRTPVGDLRQHVERTGVHVRPAGEPEGVQTPAERVHFRHDGGDRDRVRGPGQDHQAELRAQAEAGDDAP